MIKRWRPTKQTCTKLLRWLSFLLLLCAAIGYFYDNTRKVEHLDSLRFLNFSDVVKLHLEQDDPRLVDYVLSSGLFIENGSSLPYYLVQKGHDDPSEMKIGPLLEYIFKEKTGGTFFEAGAFDGEHHSTTLFVEKQDGWRGLLVEPSPHFQYHIRNKHRKASMVKACLSTKPRAMQVKFLENQVMTARIVDSNSILDNTREFDCELKGRVNVRQNSTYYTKEWLEKNRCKPRRKPNDPVISVNCLPVYTILLATGYTNLDFFSLDTEGTELQILRTIPLDKVNIKVIRVEVAVLKKQEVKEVKQILEDAGYDRILHYVDFDFDEDDDEIFYIKRKSWLDYLF